ncbi:MAG: hypothetical protein IJX44_01000 [Bacteroidaceae bacterium]|nr:hypothetical protein [Bacteroidaceae bacterium]
MEKQKMRLAFSKMRLAFRNMQAAFEKKQGALSFPDFSRRFFVSLAKKVYTFLLAILEMFTFSPIPYCSA